jgi:hypothetical protein
MILECITGSTEIPESHDAQSRGYTDVSEPQPDEFCNAAELPLKNSLLGMRPETCHQQLVNDHEYRIVVGSWNVAGMLPPDDIDLQEWLDTTQPADIYVIGWVVFNIFGHSVLLACFQEKYLVCLS